jgi:two-component system, LytTR family, response regulator
MIRAIAVDDEPVALDVIRNHAEKVPFLKLDATFSGAGDAFSYLKEHSADLVFLDIAMPGLSGLEFAEVIKQELQVVFITAYPEHALKGFELAVTDYLLKPVNFSRFLQSCQLAESRMLSRSEQPELLFVKDGYNWLPVKFSELLYIKGEDNYVSLFLKDKRIITRTTLTELQDKLPAMNFLRIHRSYIISLSQIEKIEKHQVTIGDTAIPLSLISSDSLLQRLNK